MPDPSVLNHHRQPFCPPRTRTHGQMPVLTSHLHVRRAGHGRADGGDTATSLQAESISDTHRLLGLDGVKVTVVTRKCLAHPIRQRCLTARLSMGPWSRRVRLVHQSTRWRPPRIPRSRWSWRRWRTRPLQTLPHYSIHQCLPRTLLGMCIHRAAKQRRISFRPQSVSALRVLQVAAGH